MLAAAVSAGFRESGLQSLKILENPDALPMVAVRTAGLGLSSVIAYVDDDGGSEHIVRLADERCLRLLLHEANERFGANTDRIKRLQEALAEQVRRHATCSRESREERKERLRLSLGRETPNARRDRTQQLNQDDLLNATGMFEDS